MQLNKRKVPVGALFVLYLFVVVEIILIKDPRIFLMRMVEILYRHRYHLDLMGSYANYTPFRTIRYLLFDYPDLMTVLSNIGGNILLFVPMGIFIPKYFKSPFKPLKTIITCFLISAFFEVFQLVTFCGFFDVDDMILNTLGGVIGMYIYSLFINHSSYSNKKLVATYVP